LRKAIYAKAGEGTLAAEAFARAFEKANTLEDKYSRSYWWIRIAADYTEAGQGNKMAEILARSEQLLNSLQSLELESLESYREQSENLGIFTILYAKIGLYDLAFQFANAIKEYDEYSRFLALLNIAICYVDADQYSEAIKILKLFRGQYPTAALFWRIAFKYAEQGQHSLAVETINYIDRSVEENEYQAALAVITAIRATAEEGDRVSELLSRSLEISNASGGNGLIEIVAQYAKVGLYPEALDIATSIQNGNFQAYVLESIIQQIQM
jgi:tetratricopeptide (TPR) repeat protein